MSIFSIPSVKAQKLTIEEMAKMVTLPISKVDDALKLKGFIFLKKRHESTKKTIYQYSNDDASSIEDLKLVNLHTYLVDKDVLYYITYATKDIREYQDFRKYCIEKKFKKRDTTEISKNDIYENTDNRIQIIQLSGEQPFYGINVFNLRSKIIIDKMIELEK